MNTDGLGDRRRRALSASLSVLGLWSFAIAQPVFDLLRQYPEVLIAHHASAAEVIAVGVTLSLLLPLPLMLLVWGLQRFSKAAGDVVTLMLLALLSMIGLLPLLRGVAALALVIAGVGAIGLCWTYLRFRLLRTLLVVASGAAPIFLALFLLQPEIGKLLRARGITADLGGEQVAPIPVTIVVYDALPLSAIMDRSGRIDAAAYPNFAALAADGIWYKNATTSSDFTTRAIPAILSGVFPERDKRPTIADHPNTLFSLLQASHDLVASEAQTLLCERRWNRLDGVEDFELRAFSYDIFVVFLHSITPEKFAPRLHDIGEGWRGFGKPAGGDTLSLAYRPMEEHRAFVDAIGPATRAPFYFEHIVFPHGPYRNYPSGKLYGNGKQPGGKIGKRYRRVEDPWAALHSYQRFLLQSQYADRLLGEVVESLKAAGQYDDGLVILMADHGISYEPGQFFRHLRSENMQDIMPVPLIVKLPGGEQAGATSLRNVESIDIAPTVADVLGVELPWRVDGQSMLDVSRAERPWKRCQGRKNTANQTKFPPGFIEKQMDTVIFKTTHFGDGSDPEAIFRVGDEFGMYGKAVEEFEISEEVEPRISLLSPASFEVNLSAGYLPLEIIGHAKGTDSELRLAVAVNGVIAALTRPYRAWSESDVAVWAAWISESSLRNGTNHVEVFSIEGGRRLRPGAARGEGPSYLGLALGKLVRMGVAEEGFGRQTGQELRWIGGYAKLVVPLRKDDRPAAIRVSVATPGKGGSRLEIRANGEVLFDDLIARGDWLRTFPLNVRGAKELVIEFRSDGHVRRQEMTNEIQPHHSSIAFDGIWVLSEGDLD